MHRASAFPVEPLSRVLEADDELTLPRAWAPPPRPPIPLAAASVPVVGAVVLWLVTGSALALLLAALGPLIAVATALDAHRSGRRERRRAERAAAQERARVADLVAQRHREERAERRARHPDVLSHLRHDDGIWRSPSADGDDITLVVGAGEAASGLRVRGGEGDPDAAALRSAAARLQDAPILLPLREGIAVVGPGAAAEAVHRALVLQLCLLLPPGQVRIVGDACGDWSERLPHRAIGARLVVAIGPTDEPAGAVLALVRPDERPPPGCGATVRVQSPATAIVEARGMSTAIEVEGVAAEQAASVADALAARAAGIPGLVAREEPPVALDELLASAPAPERGALPAVIGRERSGAAVVDLVRDGPHAVVAGVTGSGKSELLVSWVVALATTHRTTEVSFLLADFKGGTAFDALADLPHVTGVITDLDGSGARRALESLRAEVRWRESGLSRAGARDVLDPRVDFPRLVVVVDEFAALVADHPELAAVFSDVAARGRALGIHLVLGTQRVTGVIRDSLLANCPLRISLRVADPADSRTVIGSEAAAELPGGPSGRGLALVRRSADATPTRVRVALTQASDLARLRSADRGPTPRRPWLPALPARIGLDDPRIRDARRETQDLGALVLGLADEPDRQRQTAALVRPSDRGVLVLGGAGSGRSTALRTLAAQAVGRVRVVPSSGEEAWDAVSGLEREPPSPGDIVVIDDLDALPSRFPQEYALEIIERLEAVARGAGDGGYLVVASTLRLTGPAVRVAELLPQRLLLSTPTRSEYLALGGDPADFAPDSPPGRGRFRGLAVQVCVSAATAPPDADLPREWMPTAALTGIATRRPAVLRAALERWAGRGIRSVPLEEYADDPSVVSAGPLAVVGDPEAWQRHWRILGSMRSDHALVVDTSCAADFRALTGERTLPPFAERGRGRAWLLAAGADPVRIVLDLSRTRPDSAPRLLDPPDAES